MTGMTYCEHSVLWKVPDKHNITVRNAFDIYTTHNDRIVDCPGSDLHNLQVSYTNRVVDCFTAATYFGELILAVQRHSGLFTNYKFPTLSQTDTNTPHLAYIASLI